MASRISDLENKGWGINDRVTSEEVKGNGVQKQMEKWVFNKWRENLIHSTEIEVFSLSEFQLHMCGSTED